jgi:hypothetical protein
MYFFLRNVALSEDAWYTQGNKNHFKNLLLSRRSAEQRRPCVPVHWCHASYISILKCKQEHD